MQIDPSRTAYGVVFQTLSCCLAPRPVVLVSTMSRAGLPNLAPFSMVTLLSVAPPLVGISILPRHGGVKDTLRNIIDTAEFTVNTVPPRLAEEAVRASADFSPEVDEFAACGIRARPSERVRPACVSASPVALECRRVDVLPLPGSEASLVVGVVLLVHVDDALVRDGAVNVEEFCPLGHLQSGPSGYVFSTVGRILRMAPPPPPGGER